MEILPCRKNINCKNGSKTYQDSPLKNNALVHQEESKTNIETDDVCTT